MRRVRVLNLPLHFKNHDSRPLRSRLVWVGSIRPGLHYFQPGTNVDLVEGPNSVEPQSWDSPLKVASRQTRRWRWTFTPSAHGARSWGSGKLAALQPSGTRLDSAGEEEVAATSRCSVSDFIGTL
eukprot:4280281-Amphidinium_carterae.1